MFGSEYPTRNGFPVAPDELNLAPSRLNPNNKANYDNHHGMWTARQMGKLVMSKTCRNLDSLQWQMLMDQHAHLHVQYRPAPLPTLDQMMDRIYDAYDNGEELRFGSANKPKYRPIDLHTIMRINEEYSELR